MGLEGHQWFCHARITRNRLLLPRHVPTIMTKRARYKVNPSARDLLTLLIKALCGIVSDDPLWTVTEFLPHWSHIIS